jgi:hypothetical protein
MRKTILSSLEEGAPIEVTGKVMLYTVDGIEQRLFIQDAADGGHPELLLHEPSGMVVSRLLRLHALRRAAKLLPNDPRECARSAVEGLLHRIGKQAFNEALREAPVINRKRATK